MISCNDKALFYGPVMWVFELIRKAYGIDIIGDKNFNIDIGIEVHDHIKVSKSFFHDIIELRKFAFDNYFQEEPLIRTEEGKPDYISSIFYLVNGFQEYNLKDIQKDKYGRLDFRKSLQFKYSILTKDLVKEYVQKLLFQIDNKLKLQETKSRIFLSHDIDSVYGSLKYDGLQALKRGDILQMMKVIFQTALFNPPWFNIDKVAHLENEIDIKACYYWIVENGRGSDGIKNGDYRITSKKIQAQLKLAKSFGNEVGLHKSTMPIGMEEECKALPHVKSNRFHFLKIKNPQSFGIMEKCGIQSDSSIGFPYNMGFKNSFGMPYYPYDLDQKKKVNVLEIPLQIMDGMFDIKNLKDKDNAYNKIVDFIENNKTNAILSILWHNSEMTNFSYKWSFECYKELLQYFIDHKYETVLPSQLVNEYEIA